MKTNTRTKVKLGVCKFVYSKTEAEKEATSIKNIWIVHSLFIGNNTFKVGIFFNIGNNSHTYKFTQTAHFKYPF